MAEEVSEQSGPIIISPEPTVPEVVDANAPVREIKPAPNPEKPKRKISLSVILLSLFLIIVTALAIGTIFYNKQQTKIAAINDFESCAAAGNPIMESYPEQCSANGQTFTRKLSSEEQKRLDPTANWQTYESTNKMFSFKFPENLTFAYASYETNGNISENTPHFFKNQDEADENLNCISKKLGTINKPCDRGLFDVTDVTNFQENAKQPIQFYKSSKNSSLPSVEEYLDAQGRAWDILGPIYGLGGTQTNAETKINNNTYQIQIHIWDRYIDEIKQGATKQEIVFIKQILDTVKFTPLSTSKSTDFDSNSMNFKTNSGTFTFKAPDGATISKPTARSFETIYTVTYNGSVFKVLGATVGGDGPCPLEPAPTGEICTYDDMTSPVNKNGLKIDTYRLWRNNNGIFMLNPQTISIGSHLLSNIQITKISPNKNFTDMETSTWENELNTLSAQ